MWPEIYRVKKYAQKDYFGGLFNKSIMKYIQEYIY